MDLLGVIDWSILLSLNVHQDSLHDMNLTQIIAKNVSITFGNINSLEYCVYRNAIHRQFVVWLIFIELLELISYESFEQIIL